MTDEARKLFYSPDHWRKQLIQQSLYIDNLPEPDTYRRIALSSSAWRRREYLQSAFRAMSGYTNTFQSKSLIINGVNYGLMLEGLRNKVHKDINEMSFFGFLGLVSPWVSFDYGKGRDYSVINEIQKFGRGYRVKSSHDNIHDADSYLIRAGCVIHKPDYEMVSREVYGKPIDVGHVLNDIIEDDIEDDIWTAVLHHRERNGFYDRWYTKLWKRFKKLLS